MPSFMECSGLSGVNGNKIRHEQGGTGAEDGGDDGGDDGDQRVALHGATIPIYRTYGRRGQMSRLADILSHVTRADGLTADPDSWPYLAKCEQ
jgi:hypothetical protein